MQVISKEEVRHVIYISRPTHFDHLVLEEILTKSRSNNPSIGVTGNLIYHSDLFLQLLEGPHL
ncbi:BLUF domain-containing protein, partial [Alphaproteobacteria bacterium]|nr:BLUF domain-containing protein [Alphaproteobacteria bacterium]